MKRLLLSACIAGFLVGCESNEEIFMDREMLKVHAENAQRAYDAGQYDRAVHQARKALEFDSDYPKALAVLGYTYLQAARFGKDREARLDFLRSSEEHLLHLVEVGSETDPAVFKAYFGLGLVHFMWAQEVKSMIRESQGGQAPLVVDDPDEGSKEELWNE